MEDISLWKIPAEIKTICLEDKKEIEIPYIIKDRIILKEGVANDIFYPADELEPCVEVLNSEPDFEDIEARRRTSLFWDHDDECKNWLGEIKNYRWDVEAKAIRGDIYLVDEDAAKKTHYQLENGLAKWGISPTIRIQEKDKRAFNIQFISNSIVLDPAGGPKLMLDEEKFNTKKPELSSLEEQLYEDLELEPETREMEFKENLSQDKIKILAEEFGLTEEEIGKFSEEQLALLQDVPDISKTQDAWDNAMKEFEDEGGVEGPIGLICPKCGYSRQVPETEVNEIICPKCGAKMEKGGEVPDSIQKSFESFSSLIKINEDEHIVKMIILEPEIVDNQGHIVSEEEIRNAMYNYMENYRNLEVMHRDRAGNIFPMDKGILDPDDRAWKQGYNEELTILECFQSPIDYFENEEIVRKGSWIITLRVNDDEIWKKVKNKELTGASIGGHGLLTMEV